MVSRRSGWADVSEWHPDLELVELVQNNLDDLISGVHLVLRRMEEDNLNHVEEKELWLRGEQLQKLLDRILKPKMARRLSDICGENRFRIGLMRDVCQQSLAACPRATPFHHIINRLDTIGSFLDSPRTRPSMGIPIDALNLEGRFPKGASLESSSISFPTDAKSSDGWIPTNQPPPLLNRRTRSLPPLLLLGDRLRRWNLPPSAWTHRSQSRLQNRRRVSCTDVTRSFPARRPSEWKEPRLVLADLKKMADQSRPVQLCAWDNCGKVYTNLVDAISDAKGYHRNSDFEEVKLQWMWADHPPVADEFRRCFPWRWSAWKHPSNTVAEMNAHIAAGVNRPVRLVAQSVKICCSVTDAVCFLEGIHSEYHGGSL